MITGWKTVLIGLLLAVFPVVTEYFGTIDWDTILPAPYGLVVGGIVMAVMRWFTTTPIFKK